MAEDKVMLEMYAAEEGDSFLVRLVEEKANINILIDMGKSNTYKNILKNRLEELSKDEKLDLLILTHMHADHIEGAIDFFEDNCTENNSRLIEVNDIWHNSFRCLKLKTTETEIDEDDKEVYDYVKNQGRAILNNDGMKSGNISAKQSLSIAEYIVKGNYSWNGNNELKPNLICADNLPVIPIGNEGKIILLSPNRKQLENVTKEWMKYLKKLRRNIKLSDDIKVEEAFEFFMLLSNGDIEDSGFKPISFVYQNIKELANRDTKEDDNIVNGASISFILEYAGKKMLFLSDSHPSVIYDNLKRLVDETGYNPFFDVVKLAHHGSSKNINQKLVEMIDSKKYLISTNGRKYRGHSHPDMETLAKIITKKTSHKKELIFNYNLQCIDCLKKEELMKEHNYSIYIADNDRDRVNEEIIKINI